MSGSRITHAHVECSPVSVFAAVPQASHVHTLKEQTAGIDGGFDDTQVAASQSHSQLEGKKEEKVRVVASAATVGSGRGLGSDDVSAETRQALSVVQTVRAQLGSMHVQGVEEAILEAIQQIAESTDQILERPYFEKEG